MVEFSYWWSKHGEELLPSDLSCLVSLKSLFYSVSKLERMKAVPTGSTVERKVGESKTTIYRESWPGEWGSGVFRVL